MKISKYILTVVFFILVILFWTSLKYFKLQKYKEEYPPEPYVGPEIHLAARQGDIEKLKSILSSEPELLIQTDKYGNTPLHLAAYKGHYESVEFLISRGANVNVANNFGGTPLLLASYAGEEEIVRVLINNGAEVNKAVKGSKEQVLQIASLEGYRDYSHMYDALGGIINLKVHFIGTPLQAAAANGYHDIAEILIQNGADIQAMPAGNSALHSAAVNGQAEAVDLLISKGADVDAKDPAGLTPLCAAMFWSRERLDLNGIKEVAELLIKNGADVSGKTNGGFTPLHYAAGFTNNEIVMLLISSGADINAGIGVGDTPLNVACRYKRKKRGGVIDLLHKHGAVRRHGKNNSYDYEPYLLWWP